MFDDIGVMTITELEKLVLDLDEQVVSQYSYSVVPYELSLGVSSGYKRLADAYNTLASDDVKKDILCELYILLSRYSNSRDVN